MFFLVYTILLFMNLPDADLVDTRTAHEKKLEIVEEGFKAAVRAL
jgi:hypothetical protein